MKARDAREIRDGIQSARRLSLIPCPDAKRVFLHGFMSRCSELAYRAFLIYRARHFDD